MLINYLSFSSMQPQFVGKHFKYYAMRINWARSTKEQAHSSFRTFFAQFLISNGEHRKYLYRFEVDTWLSATLSECNLTMPEIREALCPENISMQRESYRKAENNRKSPLRTPRKKDRNCVLTVLTPLYDLIPNSCSTGHWESRRRF